MHVYSYNQVQVDFHSSLCIFLLQGCIEGEVRLAEGETMLEGRVEICRNDEWGTVCSNMWTSTDARVVCRQLGHSIAGELAMRQ